MTWQPWWRGAPSLFLPPPALLIKRNRPPANYHRWMSRPRSNNKAKTPARQSYLASLVARRARRASLPASTTCVAVVFYDYTIVTILYHPPTTPTTPFYYHVLIKQSNNYYLFRSNTRTMFKIYLYIVHFYTCTTSSYSETQLRSSNGMWISLRHFLTKVVIDVK